MTKLIYFLTSVLVFVVISISLRAQIQIAPGGKSLPLGKDTLCFSYRFYPSDTLVYNVESADSIIIRNSPILLKKRSERYQIVCDSVHGDNHFFLTVTLVSYLEKQRSGRDSTWREIHPWVGVKSRIIIDSLGKRTDFWDMKSAAGVCPGGFFSPVLFPHLGESCGRQNQSWISQDTFSIEENGRPAPAVAVMNLWRVIDNADTLHTTYGQIQYTQNGLGSAVSPMAGNGGSLNTRAIINAYGKFSFDTKRKLPFHLFATAELKLEFFVSDNSTSDGKHLISTNAHLVSLSSATPGRSIP